MVDFWPKGLVGLMGLDGDPGLFGLKALPRFGLVESSNRRMVQRHGLQKLLTTQHAKTKSGPLNAARFQTHCGSHVF